MKIRNFRNVVTKASAFMALLLVMGNCTFAGDLGMLTIVAAENASGEYTEIINKSIEDIPDYILEYHKKIGGTVTFMRQNLPEHNNTVSGIYYYTGENRYNIAIRTDEAFYADHRSDLRTPLPHELGHFVWDVGFKDTASEEDRAILQAQYQYWKNYRFDCFSYEETFAALYATHLESSGSLTQEVNDMFDRCEERVKSLNESYVEGSDSQQAG